MSNKISQKINPVFEWRWLSPVYWPLWLGFAILWLIVQLPYPVLYFLGKSLGRLLWLVGWQRRYITLRNLEICFPEKSAAERRQIALESFESVGMAVFEMGIAWWWPDTRLKKIFSIQGLEHLHHREGQGAMLLGMHFTTLDIGAVCLSCYHDYGGMYRPHKNPVFNYVQFRGRSRASVRAAGQELRLFPREDLRTMIQLLRQGLPVWYAPDQDYGAQYSVFAPFFGVPAASITATARLAQSGRARVYPFTHFRRTGARGYDVTIHPPLQNFPLGNEVEDATRINAVIEEQVRQAPGQYLWSHRRFKTRPEGTPTRYPDLKK